MLRELYADHSWVMERWGRARRGQKSLKGEPGREGGDHRHRGGLGKGGAKQRESWEMRNRVGVQLGFWGHQIPEACFEVKEIGIALIGG